MSARACPHPAKMVFSSKRMAKRALTRGSLPGRDSIHAYLCPCGYWHLGHKLGSRKGQRAAA